MNLKDWLRPTLRSEAHKSLGDPECPTGQMGAWGQRAKVEPPHHTLRHQNDGTSTITGSNEVMRFGAISQIHHI